ncbi:hypothetical protein GCM10009567_03310 [Rothia amarae]
MTNPKKVYHMKYILQFFNTKQRIAIVAIALAAPQALTVSGNGAALLLLALAGFIAWEESKKNKG